MNPASIYPVPTATEVALTAERDQLRAENARLREALEEIHGASVHVCEIHDKGWGTECTCATRSEFEEIARAALGKVS